MRELRAWYLLCDRGQQLHKLFSWHLSDKLGGIELRVVFCWLFYVDYRCIYFG